MKRTISIFLAAVMLLATFAVLPVTAAEIPSDIIDDAKTYNIAEENIVAIRDMDDFQKLGVSTEEDKYANTEGKYYYLTNDISHNLNSDTRTAFKGIFNGNNYTITSTATAVDGKQGSSLFRGGLNGATIKNLKVSHNTFEIQKAASDAVTTNLGVLTSRIENGDVTIENVDITATMTITYTNAGNATTARGIGGFVGAVVNGTSMSVGTVTFKNCTMNGSISVRFDTSSTSITTKSVGGILGYAVNGTEVVMENCKNNATITVGIKDSTDAKPKTLRVGGIIGHSPRPLELTNCTNNGAISLSDISTEVYCGGIVGNMSGGAAKATVTDCKNTANISVGVTSVATPNLSSASAACAAVGGIAGRASLNNQLFKFTRSVNEGDITCTYDSNNLYSGGILGAAHGRVYIDACRNTGTLTNTIEGETKSTKTGSLMGACYTNEKGTAYCQIKAYNDNFESTDETEAVAERAKLISNPDDVNHFIPTRIFYAGHQKSETYTSDGGVVCRKVRFVAVIDSATNLTGVGFDIIANDTGKEYGKTSTTIYESIKAGDGTLTPDTYSTEYSGKYFVLFTIGDIPVSLGDNVKFTITTYTTTDSETTTGVATTVTVDLTQTN